MPMPSVKPEIRISRRSFAWTRSIAGSSGFSSSSVGAFNIDKVEVRACTWSSPRADTSRAGLSNAWHEHGFGGYGEALDMQPISAVPFDADLGDYDDQADALLTAWRAGDKDAAALVHRRHPRFLDDKIKWLPKAISDDEVAASPF